MKRSVIRVSGDGKPRHVCPGLRRKAAPSGLRWLQRLHSQAGALIVIHKSLREPRNPEGVQAISRGLSEATPPDGKPNKISTPEGSQSFRRGLG